jgi:CRP/FNR family transcriptional regulator
MTDAEVLVRCPLFAELSEADLDALAAIAERRRHPAGTLLFLAGDRPEALHVVVSGRIRIEVASPETGRPLVLTREPPFHAVAELPSFDGGPYPAHAEAEVDSVTLALPQARLDALLDARPGLSRALLRTLGRRLRRLVGLIERLSFQEVVQRLAAALLDRAERELPFELPTNAELAAELGTVPELASRNLSRLAQQDLVALNGRTVTGVDADGLRRLASSARR